MECRFFSFTQMGLLIPVSIFKRLPPRRSDIEYLVTERSSLRRERTGLHMFCTCSQMHQFNKSIHLRNKEGAKDRSGMYLRFHLCRREIRRKEGMFHINIYLSSFHWIMLGFPYTSFSIWVQMVPLGKDWQSIGADVFSFPCCPQVYLMFF